MARARGPLWSWGRVDGVEGDARLTGSVSAGNYDNSGYDDDWTEIMQRRENGDWDLLMWAQNTLPAGDPAQFLNAFFRTGAGSNYAGLASDDVDAKLDALQVTEDHDARVAATADAHAAILAEQAVSNLLTPAWHVGLSDRMEPCGNQAATETALRRRHGARNLISTQAWRNTSPGAVIIT